MVCVLAWVFIALFCFIVIVLGIYSLRQYSQGGKYKKNTTAIGKVVLITGCNTGIGKETARELAKRGATIYMACRDMKKAEEACKELLADTGNQRIFTRQLDLSSLESIGEFVENFKQDETQLDILINNAGVALCPYILTADGFEMQLGVNHMGHFYLTNLLLDLLKKSTPSRIVVVSSIAHEYGNIKKDDLNSEKSYGATKAYCQSKLANILFTIELSKRLRGTGVTINALHPGGVESDIGRNVSLLNNSCTRPFMKGFLWPFMKTTPNGAQTSIYAALDPDLENVTGMYFSDCKLKKPSSVALDDDMARWLWTESEKWTKLSNHLQIGDLPD